jgi:hypothetical protein
VPEKAFTPQYIVAYPTKKITSPIPVTLCLLVMVVQNDLYDDAGKDASDDP